MLSVNKKLSDQDSIGLGRKGTINRPYILHAPFWTVDTLFFLTPHENYDLYFIFPLIQKINWSRLNEATGVPSLSRKRINSVVIFSPCVSEQDKIARLIQVIDSIKSLYQRQLETNTFIRKSIMQFVFPLFSMNTPRLRFNVYKNPWEKTNVSDLYKKETRKNDGSYGKEQIISVANMYYKKDALISNQSYLKTYNILKKGNIAFEGNKSNSFRYGRMVENTIGDGIVSHVFDVFEPIKDYDLNFWKYYINYEPLMGRLLAKSTTKATMMTNLVAKDFLRQKLFVPSINEQKMIGHILELLDHKIELTTNKINKLKKIKKFLLDKLFV